MDEVNHWQEACTLCSLISGPIENLSKKLTCKKPKGFFCEFIMVRKHLPEPHLQPFSLELGRAWFQPDSARMRWAHVLLPGRAGTVVGITLSHLFPCPLLALEKESSWLTTVLSVADAQELIEGVQDRALCRAASRVCHGLLGHPLIDESVRHGRVVLPAERETRQSGSGHGAGDRDLSEGILGWQD